MANIKDGLKQTKTLPPVPCFRAAPYIRARPSAQQYRSNRNRAPVIWLKKAREPERNKSSTPIFGASLDHNQEGSDDTCRGMDSGSITIAHPIAAIQLIIPISSRWL